MSSFISILPIAFSVPILCEWIELESLVRLDSAYCNDESEERITFLSLLKCSRFVIKYLYEVKHRSLIWSFSRGVTFSCVNIQIRRHFKVDPKHQNIDTGLVFQLLQPNAHKIKYLHINAQAVSVFPACLHTLIKSCSNLINLGITCKGIKPKVEQKEEIKQEIVEQVELAPLRQEEKAEEVEEQENDIQDADNIPHEEVEVEKELQMDAPAAVATPSKREKKAQQTELVYQYMSDEQVKFWGKTVITKFQEYGCSTWNFK